MSKVREGGALLEFPGLRRADSLRKLSSAGNLLSLLQKVSSAGSSRI